MENLKNADMLKMAVEKIKNAKNPQEKENAQAEAVKLLAIEFEPEAREIMGLFKTDLTAKTTENGYGFFYKWLGQFKGLYRIAVAIALENAGGSRLGIQSAMEVLEG